MGKNIHSKSPSLREGLGMGFYIMKKLNWGQSIALVMLAFMIFILSFVYKTFTNKKYDHHLVSQEYYKDEVNFQQEIDAEANANKLSKRVTITTTDLGALILFPEDFDNLEGTISFQRAADEKLDFVQTFKLQNKYSVLVPLEKIVPGYYDVKIKWKSNGKNYLFKEKYLN